MGGAGEKYSSNRFRVFVSDSVLLTLNRGFDMYVYTGNVPATWTVPPISGAINYIKVENRGLANLTLVPTAGSGNQFWDAAPANSVLMFPAINWTFMNDKFFWLVTS